MPSVPPDTQPNGPDGNALSDAITPVTELKKLVRRFIAERNWSSYHTPRNLAISISLESAELLEHFQWLRENTSAPDEAEKQAIGEEMADVFAYLLSLACVLDIDLSDALQRKMLKNARKYPAERFNGHWEKVHDRGDFE